MTEPSPPSLSGNDDQTATTWRSQLNAVCCKRCLAPLMQINHHGGFCCPNGHGKIVKLVGKTASNQRRAFDAYHAWLESQKRGQASDGETD